MVWDRYRVRFCCVCAWEVVIHISRVVHFQYKIEIGGRSVEIYIKVKLDCAVFKYKNLDNKYYIFIY